MMQCSPISSICASVTVMSETRSMQIPVQLIVSSHLMKVIDIQVLVVLQLIVCSFYSYASFSYLF